MSPTVTERALGMSSKTPRQTTPPVSTLASNVLSGRVTPTAAQIRTLAATALGQDQTFGQKPKSK